MAVAKNQKILLMKFLTRSVQLFCLFILILELACIFDLFYFEWAPLVKLMGWVGVVALAVLNTGLLLVASGLSLRSYKINKKRYTCAAIPIYISSLLVFIFMIDWMFRAYPISSGLFTPRLAQSADVNADFERFSLTSRAHFEQRRSIRLLYDRIMINSPNVYFKNPIGETIDKYANRYQIDPILLFYLAYMNSFYGEAEAGPIPLFSAMTPETVRDVVQIHLPGWFIESALRQYLISVTLPGTSQNDVINFKLRYALHKATLDVSSQPYDLNTFSDIFMVMQQYPKEFTDIFSNKNDSSLDFALSNSFRELRGSVLLKPYELPISFAPLTSQYYDEHRDALKKFSRAVYYKSALDFDFSTRVMALVVKYQRDYIQKKIGSDAWNNLPLWQQDAMTVMSRDLFVPGIGKTGYNLYALPEINCTPLEYLVSQAFLDQSIMSGSISSIWRPLHPEFLWAGTAFRVRVFNEVWYMVHGEEIPGLHQEDSISLAKKTLSRYH